ncbi:MAG: hypothetical protein LDL24_10135 [Treponema sp.]|nr:hypothetical protein [Treponema sp.]
MSVPSVSRDSTLLSLFLYIVSLSLFSQEAPLTELPGLKERAVVLDIVARVVELNETETWTSENSKVTIPGRPVTIKLVGKNVVVLAQFTPYVREDGKKFLVAQGQVWIDTADSGIKYQTTVQTIPLDYGERLFFFPLGQRTKDGKSRIEIQLELRPYVKEPSSKEDTTNTDNSSGDTPKK